MSDPPDGARIEAVQSELDCHIAQRVEHHLAEPTTYHLSILGPVPVNLDDQVIWTRGAAILEAHHLGADIGLADAARSSLFGGQEEAAEMRARLEVVAIPRERGPVGRSMEQDVGLDLFS